MSVMCSKPVCSEFLVGIYVKKLLEYLHNIKQPSIFAPALQK